MSKTSNLKHKNTRCQKVVSNLIYYHDHFFLFHPKLFALGTRRSPALLIAIDGARLQWHWPGSWGGELGASVRVNPGRQRFLLAVSGISKTAVFDYWQRGAATILPPDSISCLRRPGRGRASCTGDRMQMHRHTHTHIPEKTKAKWHDGGRGGGRGGGWPAVALKGFLSFFFFPPPSKVP